VWARIAQTFLITSKRAGRGILFTSITRGCYSRAISGTVIQYRQEKGLQRRAGRNTGTHRGGSSEGTNRKRRQRQRPLQNTNGSGGGGRYIKRGAARRAAVTGKGRRRYRRPLQRAGGRHRRPLQKAGGRYRRPLQEADGGRDGGRYINNALRQDASRLYDSRFLYTA
jgi:hypothetical protein